jgi:general nucleoside transport system permease protein
MVGFSGKMRSMGQKAGEFIIIGGLVFFVTIVILLMAGAPPLAAFYHILKGSVGSWTKITQVLTAWIPLTLCAAGLLFSFRVGLWNIGVEGQVVAGAIGATAVMKLGVTFEIPSMIILFSFVAAFFAGSLWAGLAGLLKTRGGVNEIFGGLGLNFVAHGLTLWLIFGPWKRAGVASMSGTEPFPELLWLSGFLSNRLSPGGIVLATAALLVTGWVLGRTRFGLSLKAVGSNPRAAYLHGLKPDRYFMYAMAMAGGTAGLAGAFQVAGVYHRLIPIISSNYGYLALLVVMLSGYKVGGAPAVALFFACLNVGSIQLPMMLQLDSSLSGIIQGSMVLVTLLAHGWKSKRYKV